MKQVNTKPSSQPGLLEYAVILGLITLAAILSLLFLNNNIQNILPPLATPTVSASAQAFLPQVTRVGLISIISIIAVFPLVSLKGQ
jgi:Flp pilus assembly pilin Flp